MNTPHRALDRIKVCQINDILQLVKLIHKKDHSCRKMDPSLSIISRISSHNGIIRLVCLQNSPENKHFLPLISTRVHIRGYKMLVFQKI